MFRAERHISTDPAAGADGGAMLAAGGVRALKIAIAVMTVLIAAGLAAIAWRLVALAGKPAGHALPSAGATGGHAIVPQVRAELPAGAVVRTMALGADRLALHYDAPAGAGVLIVDLASGAVLSRVDLVPSPPRN